MCHGQVVEPGLIGRSPRLVASVVCVVVFPPLSFAGFAPSSCFLSTAAPYPPCPRPVAVVEMRDIIYSNPLRSHGLRTCRVGGHEGELGPKTQTHGVLGVAVLLA